MNRDPTTLGPIDWLALRENRVANPICERPRDWQGAAIGHHDTAFSLNIATLEGAAAKVPDLAAVHYHLGMSYAAAGLPEKSAEQLKKALSLEPDGTARRASGRH